MLRSPQVLSDPELAFKPLLASKQREYQPGPGASVDSAVWEALMALMAESEAAKAAAAAPPAADEFVLHAADDGGAPSPTDAAPMLWGTRVSAVGEQPAPRRLSPRAAQIDTSMHISALASSTHFFTYRASALLKAAAAHRTFVEHCLGDQQLVRGSSGSAEQLAEQMDQQMTEEEAIEVAISLGMPRPSTRF